MRGDERRRGERISRAAVSAEQVVLRDPHRYIAHPHLTRLADGTLLLVATCGPRRPVALHPPLDPEFVNVLVRSEDDGETWSPPMPAPCYGATGAECAGLTALPDGGVLLNQWRFRWYPWDAAPDAEDEPLLAGPAALLDHLRASQELDDAIGAEEPQRLLPWARGGGATFVYRSDDRGRRWSPATVLRTAPYSGGYGLRGGVVLPDGTILLPFSDVPHYARIFAVRSADGGSTWSRPEPVAALDGHEFEEPAPLVLADGTVLMLLRENVSRILHAVRSTDGGRSWSPPEPTGIDGYPAHLVDLRDGRIAVVVGRRRPPGSIRIHLSEDGGRSWDLDDPVIVADRLGTRDLGYPTAARLGDGRLLVAYHRRDDAGVTGIHARRVAL